DPEVIGMVVEFGLESLHTMVASILSHARAIDFDGWLAKTPTEITALWQRFHQQHAVPAALRLLTESTANRKLLAFLESLEAVPTSLEAARSLIISELPELARAKKPQAIVAELREAAKVPKGGKRVWASEELSIEF